MKCLTSLTWWAGVDLDWSSKRRGAPRRSGVELVVRGAKAFSLAGVPALRPAAGTFAPPRADWPALEVLAEPKHGVVHAFGVDEPGAVHWSGVSEGLRLKQSLAKAFTIFCACWRIHCRSRRLGRLLPLANALRFAVEGPRGSRGRTALCARLGARLRLGRPRCKWGRCRVLAYRSRRRKATTRFCPDALDHLSCAGTGPIHFEEPGGRDHDRGQGAHPPNVAPGRGRLCPRAGVRCTAKSTWARRPDATRTDSTMPA